MNTTLKIYGTLDFTKDNIFEKDSFHLLDFMPIFIEDTEIMRGIK